MLHENNIIKITLKTNIEVNLVWKIFFRITKYKVIPMRPILANKLKKPLRTDMLPSPIPNKGLSIKDVIAYCQVKILIASDPMLFWTDSSVIPTNNWKV